MNNNLVNIFVYSFHVFESEGCSLNSKKEGFVFDNRGSQNEKPYS